MTSKEIEQKLAQEMVALLQSERSTPLRWTDTKQHLAEVVHYVYLSNELKDEMGCPLTQRKVALKVFALFGEKAPKNVCTYITRLNKMKGLRSQTLVDIMLFKVNEQHLKIGLDGCYS